jgi:hypothetical protein
MARGKRRASTGRGSRTKGQRFERVCCRLLSCWWYLEKAKQFANMRADELPFFRSPGSGGFATARKHQKHRVIGDVCGDVVTPEDFPFVVEMKNQERLDFDGIIKNQKWPVMGWWEQVVEESKLSPQKFPLLLMTKNLHPVYFMIGHTGVIIGNIGRFSSIVAMRRNNMKYFIGLAEELTNVPKAEVLKHF